ncbi:GIY-YIG nuclease family protein [Bradyrhizobium sp. C9]|uniref:GIY-YIG nuclease family protein n=1 Tax=Bradyrhizobium sp. C9 TaxID=142585 RepID=UPI000BEAD0BD|nr:GIY-YIG nuclease family protein [Bradyrhizobium sp. C9]PDT77236.1 hypothetical protein CO675_11910 [Bradyrhizobium sp. C9]
MRGHPTGRTHINSRHPSAPCALYIVRAGCGSLKVGIAADPEKRLAELQVANPSELVLVFKSRQFEREICEQVEEHIHRELVHHHLRGEWFACEVAFAIETFHASLRWVRARRGELGHRKTEQRSRNLGRPRFREMIAGAR